MSEPRSNPADQESRARLIDARGPWPFITFRVYEDLDRTRRIWNSRPHRKGLPRPVADAEASRRTFWRCCSAPGDLNWWIGSLFACGSLLFAFGCVLSLHSGLARAFSLTATGVNGVFFLGSIPFTSAAYLQLYQSANALDFSPEAQQGSARPTVAFGWAPHDIGWLSSALQFAGTLFFNLSTFDAMLPSLTWFWQDLFVWVPDVFGSVLFLASGYLAFGEICHAYWSWKPESLSWWVAFFNLLGCVMFMGAAAFAVVLPQTSGVDMAAIALSLTLFGAVGFFLGSCLMLPEAIAAPSR